MNYLEIVNDVLSSLNEVELTSSTFSTATGFHAHIRKKVNQAIDDIYEDEVEWPFAFSQQTQTLTPGKNIYTIPATIQTVDWESFFLEAAELITNPNFTTDISGWTSLASGTGVVAWNSSGNGRMLLNTGVAGVAAAEQAITTTANKIYQLRIRTFGGSLTLKVGTSSGSADILAAQELTYTEVDGGQFFTKTFTATGNITYIGVVNSANANYYVDYCSVREQIQPVALTYLEYPTWLRRYKTYDDSRDPTTYGKPVMVFPTQNHEFGVSGYPDKAYNVTYCGWLYSTHLVDWDDIPTLPTNLHGLIIKRLMYYAYMFRDNSQQATIAYNSYKSHLNRARRILINRPTSMRSDYPMYRNKTWPSIHK